MSGRRLFRDHDLMDLLLLLIVLAIVLTIVMVVVLVMVFNAPEWSQVVKVGDTTWLCLHNRTDIVGCETIKQTN